MSMKITEIKHMLYAGLLGGLSAFISNLSHDVSKISGLISVALYDEKLQVPTLVSFINGISKPAVLLGIMLLVTSVSWYVITGRLNPALRGLLFSGGRGSVKAWVIVVGSGLIFWAGVIFGLNTSYDFVITGFFGFWRINAFGSINDFWGINDTFTWPPAILAGGLAWLLISPQGLSNLRNNNWRSKRTAVMLLTLVQGALYMLLIGLTILFFRRYCVGDIFYFLNTGLWSSYFMDTPVTVMLESIAIIAAFSISYMLLFGLLPLFIPESGTFSERIKNARSGWYFSIFLLVASVICMPYLISTKVILNPTLAEAAGLQNVLPPTFRSLRFCNDLACGKYWSNFGKENSGIRYDKSGEPYVLQPRISSYGKYGSIPLNMEAIQLLEKFALSAEKNDVMRKLAVYAVNDMYFGLDLPRLAYAFKQKSLSQGHNFLDSSGNSMTLFQLANSLPVDRETRAMLEFYSNENLFHHRAVDLKLLAMAWARVGDMDRAKIYAGRARSIDPKQFASLEVSPSKITHGSISGRLEIDKHETSGIRVEVWRKREGSDSSNLIFCDHVVIGADGRFVFNNLTDGEYILGMQMPLSVVEKNDTLFGKNIPNKIVLDKAHPRQDVGVIQLVANK